MVQDALYHMSRYLVIAQDIKTLITHLHEDGIMIASPKFPLIGCQNDMGLCK